MSFEVLVVLILVALAFDFMNGFHDAANSIATIVSTGVLRPLYAVGWAAAFNFIAYFVFETKVASTIGKGIIDPGIVDPNNISKMCALYVIQSKDGAAWGMNNGLTHLPVLGGNADP